MKLKLMILAAALSCAQAALADDDHATKEQLSTFVKGKGTKVGPAKKSTLESPDFVDVTIKKGHCYAVEVKLADGSSWKDGRNPSMFFPDWQASPLSAGPSLIGASGAVFEPNC